MVSLHSVLVSLYPLADQFKDWTVVDEGGGAYIAKWNPALGPQPTAQQIADAMLPAAKSVHVSLNRAEASRRIYAKWPAGVQSSAALGVYPQAVVDQMRAEIASVIAAENAAADAIDAATTVAQVEAVTVAWPVI